MPADFFVAARRGQRAGVLEVFQDLEWYQTLQANSARNVILAIVLDQLLDMVQDRIQGLVVLITQLYSNKTKQNKTEQYDMTKPH